jgi:hypothetical protein
MQCLLVFFTDVSGEYIVSIFKGQADQEGFLTLEDETGKLSGNVGNQLPAYIA